MIIFKDGVARSPLDTYSQDIDIAITTELLCVSAINERVRVISRPVISDLPPIEKRLPRPTNDTTYEYGSAIGIVDHDILVGCPGVSFNDGLHDGLVFIHNFDTGRIIDILTDPDGTPGCRFGCSIDQDGDTVAILSSGYVNNSGGAIHIYQKSHDGFHVVNKINLPVTFVMHGLAKKVSISGNSVIVAPNRGGVYEHMFKDAQGEQIPGGLIIGYSKLAPPIKDANCVTISKHKNLRVTGYDEPALLDIEMLNIDKPDSRILVQNNDIAGIDKLGSLVCGLVDDTLVLARPQVGKGALGKDKETYVELNMFVLEKIDVEGLNLPKPLIN